MEAHDLHSRLVTICEQIASGDYERAKEIFDLQACATAADPINVLLEAFALMLVRIEAREFEMSRMLAELSAARKALMQQKTRIANENKHLRVKLRKLDSLVQPVAHSPAMQTLLRQADRAALVSANLLITGETGTGKGMLAKYIHAHSSRNAAPFIAINCGAIPSTLLESELFGIESGVASGVNARMGRFEQATGGTVLLDEIGDMPLESQVKLLHVIESGIIERVGGRKAIAVNVRIFAATHRNLEEAVENKSFRADLFYRLNVMRLHIPPLRERREDIPLLVTYILGSLRDKSPYAVTDISPEAMNALVRHDWPGNVRELENELERAALLAESDCIQIKDISPVLGAAYTAEALSALPKPLPKSLPGQTAVSSPDSFAPNAVQNADQNGSQPAGQNLGQTSDGQNASQNNAGQSTGQALLQAERLEDVETLHILRVLQETRGNKSKAARLLGISREGLRIKLARMQKLP